MNQDTNQETNKPRIPQKDTALHDHIKARITRKPNRIIKRSFIESAMCNHNIVMLLMGMLVFVGILGICIMPKQEMPQFTPVLPYIPVPHLMRWKNGWQNRWRISSSDTRK